MATKEIACREQAWDAIADACRLLGVSWQWIDLAQTVAERRDAMGHSRTVSMWEVALEARLPDGHQHMRHQVVNERAERLGAAVARIIERLRT
jgi:hypothetical protein